MRFRSVFLIPLMGFPPAALAADLPVADFGVVEELRLQREDWSGLNGVVFFGGGFTQGSDSLGFDAFFRSGAVGGSLGYDRQFDRVVFGVHVEGMLTNFQGTTSSGLARQEAKWLSSTTIRMGYDAGRFMPYVSAGVGFGNYKVERKSDGLTASNTHVGFVAGAGVEARISRGLFVRADYKHYEFEDKEYQFSGFAPFTADGRADMFNLGLGYRF